MAKLTIEPSINFWGNFTDDKRKTWKPSNPEINSATSSAPKTIHRGLLLRGLEIPVKEFILDGIERSDMAKLGEGALEVLMRNTKDEDKHDLALGRCAGAHKVEMSARTLQLAQEAQGFINDWVNLDLHPFTKAAVLENGVFFVLLPLFNLYGFQALREASQWISQDERMHVQTHRAAAQLLRAAPSNDVNDLRRATVEWLLKDLIEEADQATYDRFLNSSDLLMYQGLSALDQTQFASYSAFFETKRNHFASYN